MQVILTASILTGAIYANPDGECLADGAAKGNLFLLYSAEDAPSFFSDRWNTGINPDLALASEDLNSSELDRCTFKKLPRFQHRPSLITASKNLAQS